MPELAEVEFYRKQWDPGIGDTVQRVRTHPAARVFREVPAGQLKALQGQELVRSEAHGKQLCFQFSGGHFLGLHLGMSGKLLSATPEMVPGKHDHLVLQMRKTALVFSDYRMFGAVLLFKGAGKSAHPERPPWWSDLPPQPHEPAFDSSRLNKILKRHPNRPLKALLLDQQHFPGIGNWMADEILWQARLHPASVGKALSSYNRTRLLSCLKSVCEDALRLIGTDWSDPPDDWLFHRRWKDGGTCPLSGKPLVRDTIGGRTTCFSPAIQKLKR